MSYAGTRLRTAACEPQLGAVYSEDLQVQR